MTGETDNPELIEDVNKLKRSLRSHKGYKTRYQGELQALQEAMMEAPSKRTSVALENQYNKWKAKCIDVENLMIDLNNFDKDKDYRDDLKQLGNEMAEWLKKTSIAQSQLKEDFKVIAEGDSHRGIKVRLDLKPDKLSTAGERTSRSTSNPAGSLRAQIENNKGAYSHASMMTSQR